MLPTRLARRWEHLSPGLGASHRRTDTPFCVDQKTVPAASARSAHTRNAAAMCEYEAAASASVAAPLASSTTRSWSEPLVVAVTGCARAALTRNVRLQ